MITYSEKIPGQCTSKELIFEAGLEYENACMGIKSIGTSKGVFAVLKGLTTIRF
jgi:hypothetical protein